MNVIRFEVSSETIVMACSLVITGVVCIGIVDFSALSLFACLCSIIVHFAVCVFVLLASVALSGSSSGTISGMAMATAATPMSAMGV